MIFLLTTFIPLTDDKKAKIWTDFAWNVGVGYSRRPLWPLFYELVIFGEPLTFLLMPPFKNEIHFRSRWKWHLQNTALMLSEKPLLCGLPCWGHISPAHWNGCHDVCVQYIWAPKWSPWFEWFCSQSFHTKVKTDRRPCSRYVLIDLHLT